ncbi:hypothetical protein CCP4SC76_2130001 [Gammaproteobacteria bacterium]
MGNKPKRLHINIGGFMGRSYSVQLRRGKLEYKWCGMGFSNWKTEIVPVTDRQWSVFRVTLDSFNIWCWEREYPDTGVCDGTHWYLNIVYADKSLRSEGHNNFPGHDATELCESEEPTVFDRFTKAVQFLVGGRDFQ